VGSNLILATLRSHFLLLLHSNLRVTYIGSGDLSISLTLSVLFHSSNQIHGVCISQELGSKANSRRTDLLPNSTAMDWLSFAKVAVYRHPCFCPPLRLVKCSAIFREDRHEGGTETFYRFAFSVVTQRPRCKCFSSGKDRLQSDVLKYC